MLLAEVAALSAHLAATPKRNAKLALMASLIRHAAPEERALCVAYLAGDVRQPKLGVGYAQLRTLGSVPPAAASSLTLAEVHARLSSAAFLRGTGTGAARNAQLGALLALATAPEQDFLARLILGELRQGALESLVLDALAAAADVPAPLVRRAQMLSADLSHVVALAFDGGAAALSSVGIALFRPVQPMLAEPAEDVPSALAKLGTAALERKLDGARVQVHRQGEEVRVYTRALHDVTARVPELVESVRTFAAHTLILDGEALGLRPDGSPLPFQDTMRRFGRERGVAAMRTELPLHAFYFDCLFVDGHSLLDAPTSARIDALERVVPAASRVARLVTDDAAEAQRFMDASLAAGHEGVMAKSLSAPYAAGSRGAAWLKLKRSHTLDLVVLAAEWGSGRRRGSLSNLHLGARDPERGGFVMLGKTFKGLTDSVLAWQTEQLLAREVRREGHAVVVRPELVVEIEFNDVQTSTEYPGGMALRFARVKRYRPDKPASEADTLAQVRAIHGLNRPDDPSGR